jgi:hypothetical protein
MSIDVDRVRVRVLPDGRMTRKDTAAYLGFGVQTLANWAVQGKGPRPILIDGRAFYFLDDCDRYIAEQRAEGELA